MNKKVLSYFVENNWQVNNDIARKNINGYDVEMHFGLSTMYPFIFLISCHVEEADRTILNYAFKNLNYKYFMVDYCPFGIYIGLNDITYGAFCKNFENKFNNIINVLINNNIKNSLYCPICGELLHDETKDNNDEIMTSYYDGYTITLHKNCQNLVEEKIKVLNAEFDAAPNNYGKGILGSLIGAFLGAALYVIIYIFGFISSWSAIVGMVASAKLYEEFKAKKNKMMVLIVAIPNFIFQLLAVVGIYMYIAESAFMVEGYTELSTLTCFNLFIENDPDFVSSLLKDLLFSLIFSAIGIIPAIRSLKNTAERRTRL